MTLKLSIAPVKFSHADLDTEEQATLGLLKISAGDKMLTAGTEVSGNETTYREGPCVSGYHLAEWLVWNWWRLRWEPTLSVYSPENHDWSFAHRLATVGHGYVWPNITISTDGFHTRLVSEPSSVSNASNFRYTGARPITVPAAELESAVDDFVSFVVKLTDDAGLVRTNLHLLWQDLKFEREDPEMTRFRKFEALLGCDPGELDDEDLEKRLADAGVLGERALEEIAIGGGADLSGMPSAHHIAEITKWAGFDINPADGASIDLPELRQWGDQAAWRIGVSAASALRSQERLGDGPIANDSLAGLAGTTSAAISNNRPGGEFAWIFRQDDQPAQVTLRSKWDTGRRFELARLLGDNIFSAGMPGGAEPLSPATKSYSYRQRAQRTFAAELLSPWPTVKEMLGSDYSEENQEQVAEYFSVSQRTVETLIMNNTSSGYDDRLLLRY